MSNMPGLDYKADNPAKSTNDFVTAELIHELPRVREITFRRTANGSGLRAARVSRISSTVGVRPLYGSAAKFGRPSFNTDGVAVC